MKCIRVLIVLIFVVFGCSTSNHVDVEQRIFKEVNPINSWDALHCDSCAGRYTKMVEVGRSKTPKSDTLLVWVQHYGEKVAVIHPNAQHADMIASCYPDRIWQRRYIDKHVFPNHNGPVLVSWMEGGYTIFSAIPKPGTEVNYPNGFELR
jgi:hypothetical protein